MTFMLSRFRRQTDANIDENSPKNASKRALVTTIDQGFSSASNFAVGVVVARIGGPAGLGGFTLAYAFWLVLAAMHRSLITDPMAIENDAIAEDASTRLRTGFASEVTLALTCAAGLVVVGLPTYLAGQHTFGIALLAVIPWLPFLLVQDYWRWTGFMRRKPGKSLANDTVFNIVEAICFAAVWVTHEHNEVLVIASWGAGAAVGAFFGLWQFRVRPSLERGFRGLRERWHMSKWLAGNSILGWMSSQASVLLAGLILGPAGLGALRAAQTLVTGPALVLIQAGGSVGLPEASRALKDKGWRGLRNVSLVVSAAGVVSILVVGVIVVIAGAPLLRLTYGPEFSRYWPATDYFALAFLITCVGLGPILILKTTRNTRLLFRVQLISVVISIPAVSVLAVIFGVTGGALAAIASGTAQVSGMLYYSHKVRKKLFESGEDPEGTPDESSFEGRHGQPGPVPNLENVVDQIRNNDAPIAVDFG